METTKEKAAKSPTDLDYAIQKYHEALDEFVKGNPEPMKLLFSMQEDITLANPFGGIKHGRQQVATGLEKAASFFKDGEAIGFQTIAKYVTTELGSIIEIETYRAKVSGRPEVIPIAIRVTSLFRPEDGVWKVIHRQADPLVNAEPNKFFLPKDDQG